MNLQPKASGARPRVACEISPQGVVAGRSPDAGGPLSAVAKAELQPGAVTPGLKPGNIADRVHTVAMVRKAMEGVGLRSNTRGADITLIIPDAAVRVLLLDFESLPNKLSEALPLVRFRLKKLLPFEADDAMVTFQVMSHSKTLVRVLAVAIPRDVLAEYETAVREAGFEPGAVLPSTLAALAGIGEAESQATLLVNANRLGITTAIVREGILLLHRTVDLQDPATGTPATLPPALFEDSEASSNGFGALPLVSVEDTHAEWSAQEPLPEHGRNPYADVSPVVPNEPGALVNSPYASSTLVADLNAETHNSEFYAPTSPGTLTEDRSGLLPSLRDERSTATVPSNGHRTVPANSHAASAHQHDVAEAVSVAAAYFEDTLSTAPQRVWSAGPLGADALRRALQITGVGGDDGLQVRELVEPSAVASDAVSASVPRGWLAGVMGALRG